MLRTQKGNPSNQKGHILERQSSLRKKRHTDDMTPVWDATWYFSLGMCPTFSAGSLKGGLFDDGSSSSSSSSSSSCSRVSPLEKWTILLLCLDRAGLPNPVSRTSGGSWQIAQVFRDAFVCIVATLGQEGYETSSYFLPFTSEFTVSYKLRSTSYVWIWELLKKKNFKQWKFCLLFCSPHLANITWKTNRYFKWLSERKRQHARKRRTQISWSCSQPTTVSTNKQTRLGVSG